MAFVVFVIATSPLKFRMRCGTPCDTLCASWIANLDARSDQSSFYCDFEAPSNASTKVCPVPLNESRESPEGFQNSQRGLDFRAGHVIRWTRSDDQILGQTYRLGA